MVVWVSFKKHGIEWYGTRGCRYGIYYLGNSFGNGAEPTTALNAAARGRGKFNERARNREIWFVSKCFQLKTSPFYRGVRDKCHHLWESVWGVSTSVSWPETLWDCSPRRTERFYQVSASGMKFLMLGVSFIPKKPSEASVYFGRIMVLSWYWMVENCNFLPFFGQFGGEF